MAKKLTFEKFLELARSRATPPSELRDYIEFDPHSPLPQLRFRSDVLLDQPPETFNLDDEIRQIGRAIDRERREQRKSLAFSELKGVVAEGDSWFDLPFFYNVYAIAEWIDWNERFRMENIADYGHTLERILKDHAYMRVIETEHPDFFIFSAGGNDLQIGLAKGKFIHDYDPNRPANEYLTTEGQESGAEGLREIGRQYQELLEEIHKAFATLPIICHGYDYPRSLNGEGQWIGQYLKKQGIPDRLMNPIVDSVLNQLNDVIKKATFSITTARFLDCRGKTGPSDWMDDMHPGNPGFSALATIFENAMNRYPDR
ncbi:MAG: hypothetical protein AAB308_08425 [Nitrospirota bacterium]